MLKIVSYKTIYRLDYDLSFSLLDHLGKFAEIIRKKTKSAPFSSAKTELDNINHSFSILAKCDDEDALRFNLSLNTVNTVIEHPKGKELSTLHNHEAIKLVDPILENFSKLEESGETNITKFKRIGIRSFIILDNDSYEFENIKNFMNTISSPLSNAIKKTFNISEDIGFTYENFSEADDRRCKITFGPYKKSEMQKYFSVDINVEEGLILDIDVWQSNLEIPNLSFSRMSSHYFNSISKIASSIANSILDGLKNAP